MAAACVSSISEHLSVLQNFLDFLPGVIGIGEMNLRVEQGLTRFAEKGQVTNALALAAVSHYTQSPSSLVVGV